MDFDKHSSIMAYDAVYPGIDNNVSGKLADSSVQGGAELSEIYCHYRIRVHGMALRPQAMEQNLVTMVCRFQVTDVCNFCVM
jgi:hypothetical protein